MSTEGKDLFQEVEELIKEVASCEPQDPKALEDFRIHYLGTKGVLRSYFAKIKEIPNEKKKDYGQLVNRLKQSAEGKIEEVKAHFEAAEDQATDIPDLTRPAHPVDLGSRHPVSLVMREIIDIFSRIGYTIAEGPEIEDDWHNFSALHFGPDHPARDMQDTFFISKDPDIVLRTHTSPVQVRVMENNEPPIRVIAPGRVYRNETISARSHCFFHQVEGLYIDKGVSFADLKQNLYYFAREMFGPTTEIKLRPSYFPFTEPSAEVDVTCFICGGEGCPVCKNTGWVEILGCGMVDPAVLENCGIDPEEYTGFAFGLGVERITMLKYQIKDIRMLSENDVRFLSQFDASI